MKKSSLVYALMFSVGIAVPASAQLNAAPVSEIEALREDLKVLQRQVYREQNADLGTPASAADTAVKIGQFDEQLRQTMGRVDELGYKIKSLEDKIELINKDMDLRLKLLEGKPVSGSGLGANIQPQAKYAPPVANGAPKSLTGDVIAKGDDLAPVKTLSVQEIYDQGLQAVKVPDYSLAEQKFNEILRKSPENKLAGNAQYWLGEVYYAQKDYQRSAVAFAKVLEKYKAGPKGADSLLKLGMSMQGLNKKDEACQAFKSLKSEFPKAEKATIDRAENEAKKVGCK